MDDLFANAAPPTPAYGSLTHAQERRLHHTDRAQWLRYVVPGFLARVAEYGNAWLADVWSRLGDDYKRAVWPLLNREQRDLLQRAKAERLELENAA